MKTVTTPSTPTQQQLTNGHLYMYQRYLGQLYLAAIASWYGMFVHSQLFNQTNRSGHNEY